MHQQEAHCLAQRELEILDAFGGENWGELARRFDISERGMRKLVQRVRERLRKTSMSGRGTCSKGEVSTVTTAQQEKGTSLRCLLPYMMIFPRSP